MKNIFFILIVISVLFVTTVLNATNKAYIILYKDGSNKVSKIDNKINEYIEKDTCQYTWDDTIKKCIHCEYGLYNLNQHRCIFVKYEFITGNKISWWTAQNNCVNRGNYGHLVTILNNYENNIIIQFLSNVYYAWVGLTDYQQEGHFKWITGEPVTFTYWQSGRPDNYGNEDYVNTQNNLGCRWNDLPNSPPVANVTGYLCEYEWNPDFVTNLPPTCPSGYSYIKEGNKGLCVKQY